MDSYQCTSYVADRQGNQVVTFDLHVGPTAVGVLTSDSSAITAIALANGGSGYDESSTGDSVSFSSGDARATVTITGTTIKSIGITAGGSGYAVNDTITIAGSGGTGGVATVTGVDRGAVNAISLTNAGSGFTNITSLSYTTSGSGSNFVPTLTLTPTSLGSITITDGGSYTIDTLPTVTFGSVSRGTGAGAGAISLTGSTVASVTVAPHTHGHHTDPPAVTFSGGGGTGAAGTAVVENGITTSVTMTHNGSGYTSVPTITFAPPVLVEYPIDLHEPLRIDTLSDVYLDSFATFNCVDPVGTHCHAFVMNINEFKVNSYSNNQELSFGQVVIPNNGATLSGGSTGFRVHKGSKFNYICPVNPMTLHRLTIQLTLLDGRTSIFLNPAKDHRCFGELLIVPRPSK